MKAWIHSTFGAGDVMGWWIFSWHTLGSLVGTEHYLNTTPYLSIAPKHVHCFQQNNMLVRMISDWFL